MILTKEKQALLDELQRVKVCVRGVSRRVSCAQMVQLTLRFVRACLFVCLLLSCFHLLFLPPCDSPCNSQSRPVWWRCTVNSARHGSMLQTRR